METLNQTSPGSPYHEGAWIVVTAFNEQRNIGGVLDELSPLFRNIVVVDDGSRDGTSEEVLRRPAWLVRHGINLGQGASLQTGIDFALQHQAQWIVTFDADGQHQAADVPLLLDELIESEADFALGSRFLSKTCNIPISRRMLLRTAVLFMRLVFGVSLTDAHNGLRAMTRRGAQRIHITMNRMEHASELIDQIARSGMRYIEVPVNIRYTTDSLAKGQKNSAAFGLGVKLLVERVLR
jgi:glycosyltransferase involved in cell wall biosynthesis